MSILRTAPFLELYRDALRCSSLLRSARFGSAAGDGSDGNQPSTSSSGRAAQKGGEKQRRDNFAPSSAGKASALPPANLVARAMQTLQADGEAVQRLARLLAGGKGDKLQQLQALDDEAVMSKFVKPLVAELGAKNPAALQRLMLSVQAGSDATSTPSLLLWSAKQVRQRLLTRLEGLSREAIQSLPAFDDLLQAALADPLGAAAQERGPAAASSRSADDLVRAHLLAGARGATWRELLELPDFEQLLLEACSAAPGGRLEAPLRLMGLDPERLQAGAAQQMALQKLLDDLESGARARLMEKLAAGGSPLGPGYMAVAATLTAGGDADTRAALLGVHMASRLCGHLRQQLGLGLGGSERLVRRLLQLAPPAPALPMQLTSDRLGAVLQQLVAAVEGKDLKQVLASGPNVFINQLQGVAKGSTEAQQLLAALAAGRKEAMLAGNVAIMRSASKSELDSTPDGDVRRLQAATAAVATRARRLRHLLPGAPGAVVDLAQLRALPQADKEALLWGLGGQAQLDAAAGALMDGWKRLVAAAQAAQAGAVASVEDMVAAFQLELNAAELDIIQERSLPPLLEPEHLSTLPPQEELEAAARSETSDVERVLLDSFSSGSASGAQAQALAAQLMADLEAAGGVETDGAQLRLPASLREWYEQAGGALAQMSPTTLALMSKFVRLKLRYSAEDVEDVRTKLQVLLRHVQAALAAAGGSASTDGGGAQPPLWSRLHGRPGGVLTDPEQGSLDFDKLAVLLGEEQAAEFAGWAQAVALNQEGAALQPYELFAQEQLSMDLQRYLAMEADPKLHLAIEGPPSPWRDPRPLAASPEEFLEASRGLVNTYLAASELRPMSALEWETYKEYALEEFEGVRRQHEARLRQQEGASCFFNARAEEVYLRSMLAQGMPEGSPIAAQAQRYLDTVLGNLSWSFAQLRHFVRRLVELGQYFAGPEGKARSLRGSPFSPLFLPPAKEAGQPQPLPLSPKVSKTLPDYSGVEGARLPEEF